MNIASTILMGLVSGWAATVLFEIILKTNKKLRNRYYNRHEILFGHHVHHSTYGLIFIALGIIFYFERSLSDSLFYIMFGIGIIIQHTISDGRFIFIDKYGKK